MMMILSARMLLGNSSLVLEEAQDRIAALDRKSAFSKKRKKKQMTWSKEGKKEMHKKKK